MRIFPKEHSWIENAKKVEEDQVDVCHSPGPTFAKEPLDYHFVNPCSATCHKPFNKFVKHANADRNTHYDYIWFW